jgi:hypothetical protein
LSNGIGIAEATGRRPSWCVSNTVVISLHVQYSTPLDFPAAIARREHPQGCGTGSRSRIGMDRGRRIGETFATERSIRHSRI